MRGGAALRGQPLLLFVVLIASWSSVRAMTWHAPEALPHSTTAPATMPVDMAAIAHPGSAAPAGPDYMPKSWANWPLEELALAEAHRVPPGAVWQAAEKSRITARRAAGRARTPHLAGGYSMPTATDLSNSPLSQALPDHFKENVRSPSGAPLAANNFVPPPLAGDTDSPASGRRFSIDSWMLLRQDSSSAPAAIGGSYGRSQAGTVIRYELMRGSRFQPRAYLRTTRSLAGPQEAELAAGLSARPIPGLPVSVAGEVRYYRTPTHNEFRPAAYAVTQFQPQRLPLDFRAETYFQGGYVGGQFATPFIDGQVRVDRKLLGLGHLELRGGGGAWGGAQKGAERFDIGPGMSLRFGNGKLNSRLSVDYRFRVAGDAAPASGPALTLSAGF